MVKSMRGLCRATALPKVRELAGVAARVAISSFPDAYQVFDPEILQPVIRTLLEQSALATGGGHIPSPERGNK